MKKKQRIVLFLICSMMIGLFSQIPHHDEIIHAHAASYDCEYCGGSGKHYFLNRKAKRQNIIATFTS